jgi:hypothetical protein
MKHPPQASEGESQALELAIFIATVGAMLCSVFVLGIALT